MILQFGKQMMGNYNKLILKYPLFGNALTAGLVIQKGGPNLKVLSFKCLL